MRIRKTIFNTAAGPTWQAYCDCGWKGDMTDKPTAEAQGIIHNTTGDDDK